MLTWNASTWASTVACAVLRNVCTDNRKIWFWNFSVLWWGILYSRPKSRPIRDGAVSMHYVWQYYGLLEVHQEMSPYNPLTTQIVTDPRIISTEKPETPSQIMKSTRTLCSRKKCSGRTKYSDLDFGRDATTMTLRNILQYFSFSSL